MEVDNTIAYLQGAYFTEALMATVGNMFAGKASKRHEYPDKPYNLDLDSGTEKKKESEQERQLALLKAQLTTAMSNFNLSKEQRAE